MGQNPPEMLATMITPGQEQDDERPDSRTNANESVVHLCYLTHGSTQVAHK